MNSEFIITPSRPAPMGKGERSESVRLALQLILPKIEQVKQPLVIPLNESDIK